MKEYIISLIQRANIRAVFFYVVVLHGGENHKGYWNLCGTIANMLFEGDRVTTYYWKTHRNRTQEV